MDRTRMDQALRERHTRDDMEVEITVTQDEVTTATTPAASSPQVEPSIDLRLKRALDVVVSGGLLLLGAPVFGVIALLIALESRGGVFYRCRRVGRNGRPLVMLKFRKMHAAAAGPALTLGHDDRFTRVGRVLARTKLDELPQLWNVLRGDMSLVGPRPEDPRYVAMRPEEYATILSVAPGITGVSQLAFAREGDILDPRDPEGYYLRSLLPQKAALDRRYAERRTVLLDLRILFWTAAAVVARRDVAVNRTTLSMGFRRRPNDGPPGSAG